MKHILPALLSVAVVLSLVTRLAFGLCRLPSLAETINYPEAIIVGTIVSKKEVRLPKTVATRYRVDHVRYMKGEGRPDSLILVQDGGGGVWVEDEPVFEVGVRYVIYAVRRDHELPEHLRALPCFSALIVRFDSTRTEPVIYNGNPGGPLIEFTDSAMVWGADENRPVGLEMAHGVFLRQDQGTRVSEDQFVETMTRIVHRTSKSLKKPSIH